MFLARLQNETLPVAFTNVESKFVCCEFDAEAVGEDQYASNVVFAKVTIEKQNKQIIVPVLIKVEPFSPFLREFLCTNIQLYNEVFMYSKMLPFLERGSEDICIFPRFHYGVSSNNNSEESIIILQDLKPLGYRLTKNKAKLDFEHFVLVFTKLGQFHALSYAAKETRTNEFYTLASSLEETFCRKGHKLHKIAKSCLHRAIDPLLEEGKYVDILQRFLTKVDNDFHLILLELVSSTDPLAVICHGDFCRNNMLFKYNNEKPIDMRFFDIATSRCASPAIDISFILFLNSSPEFRRNHLDTLLEIYHKSLSSTVAATVKVPSLEDIKEALREKAIWGLIHCSFFLPLVLFGGPVNFEEMTEEEIHATNLARGGDEATKILNEMVEEMVQRGMIY